MGTIKRYTSGVALLLLALALGLWGCKKDGGTTGSDPGPDPGPTNATLQLSLSAPGEVEVPLGEVPVTYSVSDSDGLVSLELSATLPGGEGDYSLTRSFSGSVTSWDTTITRMVDVAGEGSFELMAESNTPVGTEQNSRTGSTTFTQRETTEAQFASTFGLTRQGKATSYTLRASDSDGLASLTLKEVLRGATDTTSTEFTPDGTDFEQTIERTFASRGSYTNILIAEDIYGEIASDTNSVTVYAPLVTRQITLDLGYSPVNVVAHLDGQQVALGLTDGQGQFSFTQELPEDSLVQYDVQADAAGLIAGSYPVESTGDQTTSLNMEPVPITIANSLPGQYPRSTDVIDLSGYVEAVDPEQGPITVSVSLSYAGTAFIIEQSAGDYVFTTDPTSDPAGVTESFTLEASHEFVSTTQAITKEIFARRDIQFLQTSFTTVERDSLVINDLRSLLSSDAEITAASVSGASTGLEVITQGEWGVVLRPTEELSNETRNYTFSIDAENIDGRVESQGASLAVESLPEFSATVVHHVQEQPVGKAYVVIEDVNGNAIDSLVVNGGVVNIELLPEAKSVRFGELRNERPYALEHRIFPENGGNYIVPVANRDKVDYWKNVIGSFSEDEIMRSWADTEITWGHGGFAGFNNNLDGNPGGYFLNRLPEFKNTANGQPEKVIVAKNLETQYYDNDGNLVTEQDSLTQQALDAIIDIYDNEFRVINPKLPPLDIQENVVYKAFDMEENNVYILPMSKDYDPIGSISVAGTRESLTNQYGNIQQMRIQIKSGSPTEPTADSQRFVFYAEGVPAFLARGRIPAYNSSPQETATNDNFNNSDMIVNEIYGGQETGVKALDVWRSHLTNSSLYQQAPNKGRFTNATQIPKVWNPDYQSLKTFCKDVDTLNDWCDDPDPYN